MATDTRKCTKAPRKQPNSKTAGGRGLKEKTPVKVFPATCKGRIPKSEVMGHDGAFQNEETLLAEEWLEVPGNKNGQGCTALGSSGGVPTNQCKRAQSLSADPPASRTPRGPVAQDAASALTSHVGDPQALSLSPSPSGSPVRRVAIISFQMTKKGPTLWSPHWGEECYHTPKWEEFHTRLPEVQGW